MAEASFEEILNSITSNPDLLNKISKSVKENEGGDLSNTLEKVISLIQNNENEPSDFEESHDSEDKEYKEVDNETRNEAKDSKERSAVGLDSLILSLGKSMSKTSPLLLALKPYLSKSRCELIDSLINMSRLASIINLAK
ncbi:MAG: hypothetical protein IKC16_01735 [Clostridia bacterium]|nr:hypothetical protein [Clostridia bacterium]